MCPAQHEGSVEEEDPVRPQEAPRPGKEPERRPPRRDVDHIQGDHRVKWCVVLYAPYPSAHVDGDRRAHIGEPFGGTPRLDAGARGRVWIARQPDEPGQRLRKADDVLPGTGANFERDALLRQHPSEHLSDWPTIARS